MPEYPEMNPPRQRKNQAFGITGVWGMNLEKRRDVAMRCAPDNETSHANVRGVIFFRVENALGTESRHAGGGKSNIDTLNAD